MEVDIGVHTFIHYNMSTINPYINHPCTHISYDCHLMVIIPLVIIHFNMIVPYTSSIRICSSDARCHRCDGKAWMIRSRCWVARAVIRVRNPMMGNSYRNCMELTSLWGTAWCPSRLSGIWVAWHSQIRLAMISGVSCPKISHQNCVFQHPYYLISGNTPLQIYFGCKTNNHLPKYTTIEFCLLWHVTNRKSHDVRKKNGARLVDDADAQVDVVPSIASVRIWLCNLPHVSLVSMILALIFLN